MMRALYDTNVVSYWMAGQQEFHTPLRKLQHDLRSLKAVLYVSSVTIQELAVVGQMTGTWPEMHDFIRERFTTVPFTSLCAEKAAALQVAVGKPSKGTKAERREAKDLWFRDAAIVGTAIAEGFEMVVTTEKWFMHYTNHFEGEIRVVKAVAVVGGASSSEASRPAKLEK